MITISKELAENLLDNTKECINQLEPFLGYEKYDRRRLEFESDINELEKAIKESE